MNERKKVLIIDDNDDMLFAFRIFLKRHGFEVSVANTAEKGLAALSVFIPDIILIDININGTDGRELCRKIKTNPKMESTPVILTSGDHLLLKDHALYGANGAIGKPFDMAILDDIFALSNTSY
jgi:DNA-binding response OmpR family regulator